MSKELQMNSNVTHPAHYNSGNIEVIEAIEDWKLGFHLGNAVKYIARAGRKDPAKEVEDLNKAIWYILRAIELKAGNPRRPNDMNPRDASPKRYAAAEALLNDVLHWYDVGTDPAFPPNLRDRIEDHLAK